MKHYFTLLQKLLIKVNLGPNFNVKLHKHAEQCCEELTADSSHASLQQVQSVTVSREGHLASVENKDDRKNFLRSD